MANKIFGMLARSAPRVCICLGMVLLPVCRVGWAQQIEERPNLASLLSDSIQQSVTESVGYLQTQQTADGAFGDAKAPYRVGVSSLCGIALLHQLQVAPDGKLREAIVRCGEFVISQQKESGLIASDSGLLYEHAYALQFLSHLQQQIPTQATKQALQKAAQCTVAAQNKTGGWRYTLASRDADVSASACQLLGLLKANAAGVEGLEDCLKLGTAYLQRCQLEDGSFSYIEGVHSTSVMPRSAAAMSVLVRSPSVDEAKISKGLSYLAAAHASGKTGEHFFYGEYYRSLALARSSEAAFASWYSRSAERLLALQNERGFWDSRMPGPEYATACACISLLSPHPAAMHFNHAN